MDFSEKKNTPTMISPNFHAITYTPADIYVHIEVEDGNLSENRRERAAREGERAARERGFYVIGHCSNDLAHRNYFSIRYSIVSLWILVKSRRNRHQAHRLGLLHPNIL